MPVKIRLMRIGAKKRPFYRVVAVDERKKRTGEYIELLGTYNPLTQPHEINLKQDRIEHWLKQGAVESDGFLRIIGKAPQKPPRKPKKTPEPKPEVAPEQPTQAEEVTSEESAPTEETPVETAPVENETSETPNKSTENTETPTSSESSETEATPEETPAPTGETPEEKPE